jgi:hypothetical protein
MFKLIAALVLFVGCLLVPSAPAASDLSISGQTQLDVILEDRPQLAAILMDRADIRGWLVEELSASDPQPLWDPTEPVTGRAAEHEYPSRHGTAPAGTALIRVSSQTSGWDQLAGLVFELHNLRRSDEFEQIQDAAVSGEIGKSEYVERLLQQEFAALRATRRFLEENLDGVPDAARDSSPLFEQIMNTDDTLEAHLQTYNENGNELTVHFEQLYEQEVVPEMRRGEDADLQAPPNGE